MYAIVVIYVVFVLADWCPSTELLGICFLFHVVSLTMWIIPKFDTATREPQG